MLTTLGGMTRALVSLTIIMAVAAVSPIVAQLIPGKFIPQTVLLLAAGAVLGPYGFGVIEVNDAVKLLSELGMAFLFLLAGYEIDPKRLAGHQGKVGLLTWVVRGCTWLVVTFLPFFAKQGINGVATVIALTTTALGTLMPILKERGLGYPHRRRDHLIRTWGSARSSPWPSCYPPAPAGRPCWCSARSSPFALSARPCRQKRKTGYRMPFPYGKREHVIADADAADHAPAHLPRHHFRTVRSRRGARRVRSGLILRISPTAKSLE